jgi:L-lactate dehydrogenase complex protein LldG
MARNEILKRLRQAARPALVSPPPWRSRRHFDDLAARFGQALTAAKGELWRAADTDAAIGCLESLLQQLQAQRIVANDEPFLREMALPGRWPDLEWRSAGQSAGDWRAFCAQADVGISSATAALAETGSIVVSSGPGCSRLTALLPPVHVAIVPVACLTADIFTWTAVGQGSLPAVTTLISGPSKTADIEQTLAIGVHGPKRFIVILVGVGSKR